jgi:hypothetical protein
LTVNPDELGAKALWFAFGNQQTAQVAATTRPRPWFVMMGGSTGEMQRSGEFFGGLAVKQYDCCIVIIGTTANPPCDSDITDPFASDPAGIVVIVLELLISEAL